MKLDICRRLAAFREALHRPKPGERRIRCLVPQKPGEPHHIFLFFPKPRHAMREQYREMHLKVLGACCEIEKLEHPEALDIIGLAMESGVEPGERSVDAAYFDARSWSDARAVQQHLQIHVHPVLSPRTSDEPPLAPLTVPPITVLPESMMLAAQLYCGCGSGLSYAACRGRNPEEVWRSRAINGRSVSNSQSGRPAVGLVLAVLSDRFGARLRLE